MKCAVEGCIREASKDCGFQQIGTVGEMEIKTSGLLCKSYFQQAMNGGRKEEPKQEYCAGCGIAFWKKITGEPVLTRTLNGKKYCNACFKKQQIKYCVECGGTASNTTDTLFLECPLCHGSLCYNCAIPHEKRAHPQKEPEAKTCFTCGADAFNDLEKCEHCDKIFCVGCQGKHWQQAHEKCYYCAADFYAYSAGIIYCKSCFQEHQAKKQRQKEKCADCGKEFSKLFSKPYCIECFQRRQNQQKDQTPKGFWEELFGSQTYTTQQKDGFSYGTMEEEVERLRRIFGGHAHFYSGSTAGQQQTKWNPGSDGANWKQAGSTSGNYTYIPSEIKEAFKVLGIEPSKDAEKIKKAYKAKALVFHPDVGGEHQDMVKLNKAKDVALKWAGGR